VSIVKTLGPAWQEAVDAVGIVGLFWKMRGDALGVPRPYPPEAAMLDFATTTSPDTPVAPPPAATPPNNAPRRVAAVAGWTVLFAVACELVGLPTDPVYVFAWLWAATVAWNSHLPWREHLRFGRDWAPAVLLLAVYTVSRGYADRGAVPHVLEMLGADVGTWGWITGGLPPTVWLQDRLYDPGAVHWWDVAASFVYFSHFVLTPAIAVVLWLRDRASWAAFMRRWIALSAAGLATYFLYPAAPPWWAAQYGLIPSVHRLSTRGWDAIGLHGAGNLLNAAQLDASNPIAAMPSLHTAFALLAVAFFAPRIRQRWWPLLAAYPLAMTFTLVYGGEHWIIDVLIGWCYVAIVLAVVGGAERWWRTVGGFGPQPPFDVADEGPDRAAVGDRGPVDEPAVRA
jgi:membrane-associated phospholipid phosphatase